MRWRKGSMPSERRPGRPARIPAGLRQVVCLLLGAMLLVAASAASAGVLLGDTNCDGVVNQADFDALLAGIFGVNNGCPGLDVNGDGVISAGDVVALLDLLPPGRSSSACRCASRCSMRSAY